MQKICDAYLLSVEGRRVFSVSQGYQSDGFTNSTSSSSSSNVSDIVDAERGNSKYKLLQDAILENNIKHKVFSSYKVG